MQVENKESLLNLARNADERLFAARCLDYVHAVVKAKKAVVLTGFLDPGQVGLLEDICRGYGEVRALLWGGYPEAERRRALVVAKDNQWYEEDYKVEILQVVPLKTDSLPGHRDYLGSLMGLGINRDKIGDIVRQDKGVAVFAAKEILAFLSQNLNKVGRYPVTVQLLDGANFEFSAPVLIEKVVTTASPRLDALVGKAFNLSRTDSTLLVQQGKVFQNWRQQVNPSKLVVEGDVISCRGRGRFRVLKSAGMTKKAREKFILGFDPEYK
ncbi:MAG: hypothetical protein A4E52_00496 [Pelotomaculum sp. PtaB.Bin013]|uniref:YlmH/Sll1252 family protein n=1 Tax=Pelotomaculum isophthalicicum JI TaxID=947010 RepID=A0A9X4H463_9FIRM|nr:YlmH/Sll1252 family protein [Pelotomaculum isophthalicicum]MDF9408493.1 YlmH/Sll1252 family protein [Pelotomaculum isophthalicicum JI]OPX91501.1 MAG: hypothetical protein A4E52_00496 [Pelotomaculum sp. PtaB.Bin013]